jgi:tRNA(Ile)-lysidine synthase
MADSRKSPSSDKLPAVVADCIARYVPLGDDVVVGLSGGIDSVVLLHALRACHKGVSALHVHHGLNKAADRWMDFCRGLCTAWHIPFSVKRVDVERNSTDGLEAAARRARHDAYGCIAADWIVLAHHQGDRAETMLFNLLRGAGVRGAGAMRERNGRLLRPLLRVGRAEIVAYARKHGLDWVEDESNADTRYARNFLRHRIMPDLQQRFPAAEDRLASAAARFAEATDLLDKLALLDLGNQKAEFPISVVRLVALPEPRARNVLRFLLSAQGVGIPSEQRLTEGLRQCLTARPDRHPAIAFGRWILRRRGHLIVLEPFDVFSRSGCPPATGQARQPT